MVMDHRVKAAVAIIESEFAKLLREREVARRIGVSPSYFRHLFKTVMGVSFSRYVRQYRVARGNETDPARPHVAQQRPFHPAWIQARGGHGPRLQKVRWPLSPLGQEVRKKPFWLTKKPYWLTLHY